MAEIVIAAVVGAGVGYALTALAPTINQEGNRLKEVQITSSTEGSAMTRLYGRARLGGQLIWATKFRETKKTEDVGGGKGGGGGTSTTYSYNVSFAVALCEGNDRAQLGRVWADGKVLNLASYPHRFYNGSADQLPDPHIQSVEGADNTPAFRGTCYIVFEDMDLTDFGNRIPQITCELTCPVGEAEDADHLIEGVCMIPASGEFTYATEPYISRLSLTETQTENVHNSQGTADVLVSLDSLDEALPNCETVLLVVGWFGDDLRCGEVKIQPRVEAGSGWPGGRLTLPDAWEVDGLSRDDVPLVSRDGEDRPVYGGTPSDESVKQLITELKARGKRVIFYPFILMDIPATNSLPDPYGGSAQAANPWRGRMTCHPAPGQVGTVDKTATAATQMANAFTGTWGLNRMMTHYANLCVEAGGVDGFLIGSELVGLTSVRSSSNTFPAVGHLVTLAGTIKGIVGGTCKVGYAADWSEYHSYRPADGTGDVYFNMDPLWSSANVDFIGIDNYLPMTDHRPGSTDSIYSMTYLKAGIEGGEYYDWYYQSQAARNAKSRTLITDGSYGKPWVFRQKDIRNWWANSHVNRPGGVESGGNTSWVAKSKPIWFTEIGCPTVDRGTNQPNVFVDPKSSESAVPHFSAATRDDAIQKAYLKAMIEYWRDNSPVDGTYGGPMLDTANMFVWCWDARPFPAFPYLTDVWSDGPNYDLGHWINGKIGGRAPLADVVRAIARRALPDNLFDVSGLQASETMVTGYYCDGVSSPRDDLAPLMSLYAFDAFESGGIVRFRFKSLAPTIEVAPSSLVPDVSGPLGYSITREQDTELPSRFGLSFIDELNDYQNASASGVFEGGDALNTDSASFPVVMPQAEAKAIADRLVQERWTSREKGEFALPPSQLAVEAGDYLKITGRNLAFRLTKSELAEGNKVGGEGSDPTAFSLVIGNPSNPSKPTVPDIFGTALLEFMDLPLLTGTESEPQAPRLAAAASPWPGSVAVLRANNSGGYDVNSAMTTPIGMGELRFALYSGPTGRWDNVNSIYLQLYTSDVLSSVADLDVLAGKNALAVKNASGGWEIIQFASAVLTGERQYTLSRLLRGQLGSEHEMPGNYAPGARVVLLSPDQLAILKMRVDERGIAYTYRYGPAQYPTDSTSYQSQSYAGRAQGLRPWSPVHLKLIRLENGDLSLSWIRRTRFGGDTWDGGDVPLNEEIEAYEVDIYKGTNLVRTLASTTPNIIYSVENQITDFGSEQISLHVEVYQLSAAVGRGSAARAQVNVWPKAHSSGPVAPQNQIFVGTLDVNDGDLIYAIEHIDDTSYYLVEELLGSV